MWSWSRIFFPFFCGFCNLPYPKFVQRHFHIWLFIDADINNNEIKNHQRKSKRPYF